MTDATNQKAPTNRRTTLTIQPSDLKPLRAPGEPMPKRGVGYGHAVADLDQQTALAVRYVLHRCPQMNRADAVRWALRVLAAIMLETERKNARVNVPS